MIARPAGLASVRIVLVATPPMATIRSTASSVRWISTREAMPHPQAVHRTLVVVAILPPQAIPLEAHMLVRLEAHMLVRLEATGRPRPNALSLHTKLHLSPRVQSPRMQTQWVYRLARPRPTRPLVHCPSVAPLHRGRTGPPVLAPVALHPLTGRLLELVLPAHRRPTDLLLELVSPVLRRPTDRLLALASLAPRRLTVEFLHPRYTHLVISWRAGPSNRAAAQSPVRRRLFRAQSTHLDPILGMDMVLARLDMALPPPEARRTLLRLTPAVLLR